MSDSIWDDPEVKGGGEFVTFNDIGDNVAGTITGISKHTWPDGKVSPQIYLDTDDGERTVTAGQVQLKSKLAEARPKIGDKIRIELTDIEKRQGGKTLKHFDVKVRAAEPTVSADDF